MLNNEMELFFRAAPVKKAPLGVFVGVRRCCCKTIKVLKQAFGQCIVFGSSLYKAADRRDPLLIFLLIFHLRSPKSVSLRGSAVCRDQTASRAKIASAPTD